MPESRVPRPPASDVAAVFAAGDIVRGAPLVVWAVRDGQVAALAIDAYIEAQAARTRALAAAE